MQVHDLQQGSPEWHAHRPNYWNASDAPAMMSVSKHKTRSELLHERHTGIVPEADVYTQRRFDEGHRFEALARSLAEEIVGESLYPVTGTEGKFSASFDGLTMLEDVAYEHKRLNDSIRAAATVNDLDQMYHVQMEQQCLVSGAQKVLFLATNWDEQGNLLEAKHFWYSPNLELRERIIQGWEQFAIDLAEYVPIVHAEKPQAGAIMQLPALAVQIRGEVILSNLPEFRKAAEHFIANIKTDLQTDEDFANAEETVKFCDKAEKELELAKKAAIAQTASIDELMRTIDHIKDELRSKRLMLDKAVKTQKEAIKSELLVMARAAFSGHISILEAEIKPIKLVFQQPDFIGAAKNKRTLASLHDAINTALANGKIAADATAKEVRAKLAWHKGSAKGYEFLFSDLDRIIYKSDDDFQMLIENRIAQHKMDEAKKRDLERLRIQAEEQKKAEEKVRAEQEEAAKKLAAEASKSMPETSKPVLVKSEAKSAISPALMGLARHDAAFFRKKYSAIPELAGVMREIDLFVAATEKTA